MKSISFFVSILLRNFGFNDYDYKPHRKDFKPG